MNPKFAFAALVYNLETNMYLFFQETDYMGVVFHFYDSEEEESDDEEPTQPYARGRISRHTTSSKQTSEQRSVTLVFTLHRHFSDSASIGLTD